MTDKLRATLRYCATLFVFIAPLYYVIYLLFWEGVAQQERIITALMYGSINVLFLGALHYALDWGRPREESPED